MNVPLSRSVATPLPCHYSTAGCTRRVETMRSHHQHGDKTSYYYPTTTSSSISTNIPCIMVYTKRCYQLAIVDHRMLGCRVALVAALTWPKSDSTPRRDSDRSSAQLSAKSGNGKSLSKRQSPLSLFDEAMLVVCHIAVNCRHTAYLR